MKRRKPVATIHSNISLQDLKSIRENVKIPRKSVSKDVFRKKQNDFEFLETLFEIRKELNLQKKGKRTEKGEGDILENNFQFFEENDIYFNPQVEKEIDLIRYEDLINIKREDNFEEGYLETIVEKITESSKNMAEEVDEVPELINEEPEKIEENEKNNIETENHEEDQKEDNNETENHEEDQKEDNNETDNYEDQKEDNNEQQKIQETEASESNQKMIEDINEEEKNSLIYEISSNFGELGIPIKPGEHADSQIEIPLADSAVTNEMKQYESRMLELGNELEQLKEDILVFQNKEELTEEDAKIAYEKQETLMKKITECDQYTRKLQRLVGLTDPSSRLFAEMFNMLPYPHWKSHTLDEKDLIITEKKQSEEEVWKLITEENRFEFPQAEYPEDKIPRIIICGNAENKIPKIIVADSKKRETKEKTCLENLTGKLNESLYLQEKLVKENAMLEGGKYKLAEELLERDKAVEKLERKINSLQAELRLVVRENIERNRQIACLNDRVQTYPHYRTAVHSPRSTYSPRSARALSCCCSSGKRFKQTLSLANCNCNQGVDNSDHSPRLSAGGSTESFFDNNVNMNQIGGEVYYKNTNDSRCSSPVRTTGCTTELENNIAICADNSKQLDEQLKSKECEVRNLQLELQHMQRERIQLVQQKKLLKCTGPCATCTCCPPMYGLKQQCQPQVLQSTSAIFPQIPNSNTSLSKSCSQQQLRELGEKYNRLQDDYKSKVCEVSCMRADAEKLKSEAREAKNEKEQMETKLIDLQERLKIVENERKKFYGSKEQLIEQEQALNVAKRRFLEAQDELEELRSMIQEHATQVEEYRNKYLQAQQQAEEQKRQLDLMEMDNARMNENVTLEIGRVKNQFQEKLAELAPLPDILKQTQVKLQEAQQMRMVAERNCEDFSREILSHKEKIQNMQDQLDFLRCENQAFKNEQGNGSKKYDELEKNNCELKKENERLKNCSTRLEEQYEQLKKRFDEKLHEIAQLSASLEQVREDSARQVARTKERCDAMRKNMQNQISEMEKELVQCRATARTAQKDRDEIRQKMQTQINNLNESFEQAQGRIKLLQGHVNFLKDSCGNIFQARTEAPPPSEPGIPRGYNSCDCNF